MVASSYFAFLQRNTSQVSLEFLKFFLDKISIIYKMACKILHGMYISQEQCKECCGIFEKNLSFNSNPKVKYRTCTPIQISGIKTQRLPYGFGIYARKLFNSGRVSSSSNLKKTCYSAKPVKIYSSYTFATRGPSYTC